MLERILHHCDSCFQFPSPIAAWNTTPAFGYKPDIQLRSHKGRKRHFWAKCHIRDGVLPQICLAHCGRWSPGTSGICRRVFSSWFVCPPSSACSPLRTSKSLLLWMPRADPEGGMQGHRKGHYTLQDILSYPAFYFRLKDRDREGSLGFPC